MGQYKATTEEDNVLIAALYEDGMSSNDIAEKFDCHPNTILNKLHKAGVKLRQSGWSEKARDKWRRQREEVYTPIELQ